MMWSRFFIFEQKAQSRSTRPIWKNRKEPNMFSNTLLRRSSLLLGLMLLLMLAVVQMPGRASAAFIACGGDPILYLSDGTTLTVATTIGTDVSSVKSVIYTIHTQHGVTLQSVAWIGDPGLLAKESLVFHDDAQVNQYLTDVVVQTTYNKVNVMAVSQKGGLSQSVSGVNAQHLKATLLTP
jgi:hypothetical protein